MTPTPRLPGVLLLLSMTVGLVGVPLPAYADQTTMPTHLNSATGANAKINDVKLAGGTLYYEDDSATTVATSPVRTLFARTATQTGGLVSVGPESTLAADVGAFDSASGDRYAYSNAANTLLTVVGPGARTVVLDPLTTTDVKLSGSRLLVSTTTGDHLTDLVTGATTALPAGTNLAGRYAVWFNADGSVDRRDLTTGTTLRVRPAGGPSSCSLLTPPCTVANSKTSVKAWGSYVLWRFDNETGWVDTSVGPTRHYLPTSKGTSLGNGLAVAKDTAVPANLVSQDLTVSPVATATLASNVKKFTFEDRVVAWSDATTNAITVASLATPAVPGSGRLLTADASPAFSPNGDGSGDQFSGEWDFAKPVDSWVLSVTDATGATVHSQSSTGPAGSGVVRSAWAGTDDATGLTLPDGVYTWHLSGTAADGDGALVGDDGATGGMSGTVVISRALPGAKVSAPALSTTLATRGVPVTWGSTTASQATYAVSRFDVAVAANRSATYTAWLNGTTALHATYAGTPGSTYRFRVRARDNAGNVGPWVTSGPSILPFDDRSTALGVRGTWTAVGLTSAYLGTERYAGAKGASLTYTGAMSGFRVIALRGATCGRFTVLLDGKAVAGVDTYSATTKARQLVYSRSISSTPGRHTVSLVVQGTAGRPRVYLDGFGTLR